MDTDGSAYAVELFASEGFQRKRCEKCKRYYWTLDPERDTCGEPPCDEYGFIGNSPSKKRLDLHEMRELYLSFFEKNGHGRVSRYPIVARWRDDVFFTQASIYCFQPWVINGTVKPPANPLTISQPCVRFNDIDNVGKTGRHFTMFEMMAHHCFNKRGEEIYFKDRTVELCHKLLTGDLGIDPALISYIESQWAGGGNSGPCFETLVSGIELSTLVFMMYEGEGPGRKEMDIQVVDTGYGLERFTWLSQGTSSAYEAVFGNVLSYLKKEAGIYGDERILSEYSKIAGMMSVESNVDLKILRGKVAERLGITVDALAKEIGPMESLYTICDHSRALMFMLQDGVLPSNVKEGYFARMLVRRAIRSLDSLKLDVPLSEIVGMQLEYFKNDFPELSESGDELKKLVDVEEDKYKKTLSKGRSVVSRIDEGLKGEGKTKIDLDSLISLYDSQGLTPDLVREFSTLEVDVPDDFYIQVAKTHEGSEEKAEEKVSIEVPKGLPETVLGFYTDPSVRKFKSKIVSVFGSYLVLEKTYFYPEGGGQETDLGFIAGMPVVYVKKIGGLVIHEVRGDISGLNDDQEVDCEIDWDRRLQLAQHHTATHVVNGAARRVLGTHVWQTGAHKSVKGARLDITHYASITDEELKRIEDLANKVVSEGRSVRLSFMDRVDAENTYGFRLYQGGVVPGGEIRVVDIKDWDVEACGGIHLDNTLAIGSIKFTGSKRIQDGVVRLEYTAGKAAENYAREQEEIAKKLTKGDIRVTEKDLARVAKIFSVQVEDLEKTIERFSTEWTAQRDELKVLEERLLSYGKEYSYSERYERLPEGESYEAYAELFDQWKSQRKELEFLREELAKIIYEDVLKRLETANVVKQVTYNMNVKDISEMVKKLAGKEGRLLIFVNVTGEKANVVVASSSEHDASEIAKKLAGSLGGGSHGNRNFAVGGGSAKDAASIVDSFGV